MSSKFFQQRGDAHFLFEQCGQLADRHTLLLHGVAVAQCYRVVSECVVVNGDAIGRTHSVLSAIALTDGVFLFVFAVEVELELVQYFLSLFGPFFATAFNVYSSSPKSSNVTVSGVSFSIFSSVNVESAV